MGFVSALSTARRDNYFDSLLSFSDISETLKSFFQYINCYSKLHNIEKNWKILVHPLTPREKNDIDFGVDLCLNAYKVLMHTDDLNESLLFGQEEKLATRYWIAYVCLSDNSSPSGIHSATGNSIKTTSIDYTVFHKETEIKFVNIKSCLSNFSYNNSWEALLIAKLFKGSKTKYN